MSTRAYDYILQLTNTANLSVGDIVYGQTSNSVAELIDITSSNVKVKLSNVHNVFLEGETVLSNSIVLYDSTVSTNLTSQIDGTTTSFTINMGTEFADAVRVIADGYILPPSKYEVNTTSNTITFYPTAESQAEELVYIPYPPTTLSSLLVVEELGNVESTHFTAKNIESVSTVHTSILSNIYNSPYIAEKNNNSQSPLVRLYEIDYPASGFPLRYAEIVGELYSSFNYTVEFGGVEYTATVLDSGDISIDSTGKINETYLQIANFDGNIASLIEENNDLLGANVSITTTYAKFLDYWPEYSSATSIGSNTISVKSSLPYRVGDIVTSNSLTTSSTITSIYGNELTLSSTTLSTASPGDKILIVNGDADSNAFILNRFRINRLDELNEFIAKFSLTNWTQFFKLNLPRRKITRDTCPWQYKGAECQYPSNGIDLIPNTQPPISANGFFTANNVSTLNSEEDVCSKTYKACALRNNLRHFGGFPGAKR